MRLKDSSYGLGGPSISCRAYHLTNDKRVAKHFSELTTSYRHVGELANG